jgi:hypothetical protein
MIVYQSPPQVPKQDDPAVKEAERKQRVIEAGIGGRGATLLNGGANDNAQRAAGSRLLGNFGALG